MRHGYKYVVGITSLAVVGLIIFLAKKDKKVKMLERLDRIADEGYELAHDVLYPLTKKGNSNKYRSFPV